MQAKSILNYNRMALLVIEKPIDDSKQNYSSLLTDKEFATLQAFVKAFVKNCNGFMGNYMYSISRLLGVVLKPMLNQV